MKRIISYIFFFFVVVSGMFLASCKENTEYKLLRTNRYHYDGILGGGSDTLRAGECMKLKTYYSSLHVGKMECIRNGREYSIPDNLLANVVTGALLSEDQAVIEHRSIAETIKIDGVSREDSRRYFFYAVYALCFILFVSLPVCVIMLHKKTFVSFRHAAVILALPSLAANICYTYYTLTLQGNSYWFLLSPSEYGFWWMIADWLAFFILSFVNLAAFYGVLVITRMSFVMKTHRPPMNFFLRELFLFFVVWLAVYIFSSTAYNKYFIAVLLGVVILHLLLMLLANRKAGAAIGTVVVLWIYMWACLPAVLTSTVHAVILIPLLFVGGSMIWGGAKGIVSAPFNDMADYAGVSSSGGTYSENRTPHYCANCSFYERSSGRCFNKSATSEGPYRSTSCPFYQP